MAGSSQEPTAVFECSTGERDGFPVVAVINVAFVGDHRCAEFPWLLELEMHASHVDKQGFPEMEEVDRLNRVEERLEQLLAQVGARFIARQTWNGRRMVDYYVADEAAARRCVDEFLRSEEAVGKVHYRLSKDESWSVWMPTLTRMAAPAAAADRPELEQAVLVRIPLQGGEFGSEAEQEQVQALSSTLTEIADESAAGVFDGYEFGNREAVLFAYGPDADKLFAVLKPALHRARLARGTIVTRRYGPTEAAREKTVRL